MSIDQSTNRRHTHRHVHEFSITQQLEGVATNRHRKLEPQKMHRPIKGLYLLEIDAIAFLNEFLERVEYFTLNYITDSARQETTTQRYGKPT